MGRAIKEGAHLYQIQFIPLLRLLLGLLSGRFYSISSRPKVMDTTSTEEDGNLIHPPADSFSPSLCVSAHRCYGYLVSISGQYPWPTTFKEATHTKCRTERLSQGENEFDGCKHGHCLVVDWTREQSGLGD